MTRFLMFAALIGVTVACAAASQTSTASPLPAAQYATNEFAGPDVGCDIYRARTLHGLRLEAAASGYETAPDLLEYEFVVTKSGPSGSSDIMQSGEVSEAELGAVDLSLERGDRFHATLTLRDSQGEVCAAEIRS